MSLGISVDGSGGSNAQRKFRVSHGFIVTIPFTFFKVLTTRNKFLFLRKYLAYHMYKPILTKEKFQKT